MPANHGRSSTVSLLRVGSSQGGQLRCRRHLGRASKPWSRRNERSICPEIHSKIAFRGYRCSLGCPVGGHGQHSPSGLSVGSQAPGAVQAGSELGAVHEMFLPGGFLPTPWGVGLPCALARRPPPPVQGVEGALLLPTPPVGCALP